MEYSIVTEGLEFPEGPIWMKDGSVIVVEIAAGRLSRVKPDGSKQVVATTGGGPNGAAIGPNGTIFVCNNGGFEWSRVDGYLFPGHQPADYAGGRIEVVDINTGKFERMYDRCGDVPLRGPNDIVFDGKGGFYFTDLGKSRSHDVDTGGIYYAKADGSGIKQVIYGLSHPNGCGLSPDGKTLYVALTTERMILGFDIVAPGELAPPSGLLPGRVVASFPGRQLLDSMAIDANGHVCQATLLDGPGVASVDPATGVITNHATTDILTTNICFGGADMQDAWVTLSGTGKLAKTRWATPGLKLAYYA